MVSSGFLTINVSSDTFMPESHSDISGAIDDAFKYISSDGSLARDYFKSVESYLIKGRAISLSDLFALGLLSNVLSNVITLNTALYLRSTTRNDLPLPFASYKDICSNYDLVRRVSRRRFFDGIIDNLDCYSATGSLLVDSAFHNNCFTYEDHGLLKEIADGLFISYVLTPKKPPARVIQSTLSEAYELASDYVPYTVRGDISVNGAKYVRCLSGLFY